MIKNPNSFRDLKVHFCRCQNFCICDRNTPDKCIIAHPQIFQNKELK